MEGPIKSDSLVQYHNHDEETGPATWDKIPARKCFSSVSGDHGKR